MPARLIPLDGGPPVTLARDVTVVGRTADCDVRLNHKSVSKMHCVLVPGDGLVLLRDLGSTNGTRVNGQRVRRAALLPNDHLAVANFRYRVTFGDADPDGPTEAIPPPADAAEDDADTPPPAPAKRAKDPEPPLRRNALPDVYPDEDRRKK